MASLGEAIGAQRAERAGRRERLARALAQPARLFVLLSLVFGSLVAAVDPPLRGHDEAAHVLRAYGLARGEVLTEADADGRRGLAFPARLERDFSPFARQVESGKDAFDFRRAFRDYAARRGQADDPAPPPVFLLYAGSEAYTPAAYPPHIGAVWVARLLGLDFVQMLYVMRIAGLVFATAIIAAAIRITPRLKWAFFLIGMLPAALYGRAIVSADGGALSYAMLATALSLRAVGRPAAWRLRDRAGWMFLCILGKPSQIAFALLVLLNGWSDLRRHWRAAALIALPGLVATALWIVLAGADVGTWRIVGGTGVPAEQFTLGWKLGFMLAHPLHFPTVAAATLTGEAAGLWRQLIGVLGWLDVPLASWVYVFVSVCLVVVALEKLDLDAATRARIALVCALLIGAYGTLVFLILFITWTPAAIDIVWGVQGRYFVVVLPAAALMIAALVHRALDERIIAAAAISAACVSAGASLLALWQVNWG